MGVKLSCADYGWPSVSHQTALAIIADLGFHGVDIGVFADATHVTVGEVVADPAATAAVIASRTAAAGLAVPDVFLTASLDLSRLSPTSRAPGDQQALSGIFDAMLEFAALLGAGGVTLLPGVVADGESVDIAIGAAAEGLAPLVAAGAGRGLGVSVEPHTGSVIESPTATARLLERCPGLTITLDPSHFVFGGWGLEDMAPLLEHTRHVQVRPAAPGRMQVKVSENHFDLLELFRGLRACGYTGWLASEFVWMEKWRCDEVDNTGESGLLRAVMADGWEAVGG